MQLDVGTVRHPLDDAGLDAVRENVAVTALQGDRPAIGDEEHQWRQHQHADTPDPGRRVERDMELVGNDVVHRAVGQQHVERDGHRADTGADRNVTRALQQVVMRVVPGELPFDERVGDQQQEDHAHQHRHPDRGRDGVVADVDLPRREEPDQPVGPHHVEVGLRAGRDLGRFVGAEDPDRVDLEQSAHQAQDADDHGEECAGLDGEHWHDPHANHVGLSAARAGELGVLLEPDQRQVNTDERQHDSGEEQNVHGVETGQQDRAGEVPAEDRPVHPGSHHRDAQCDRGQRGPDAGARQQVVGQRVAEESLEHRQDQQQRADHPVGLTRPAERTGEEDAGQVDHDRRSEQQCRPMVDLADEQSASHLKADVEGGLVGA